MLQLQRASAGSGKTYTLTKIYIRNDQQLSDISHRIYGAHDVISKTLIKDLETQVAKKKKEAVIKKSK